MDYQAVSVGNPQMQYRPTQLSSGYNQMNFPTYSPSMSQPPMPFGPPQPQGVMYVPRNPPMTQNIGKLALVYSIHHLHHIGMQLHLGDKIMDSKSQENKSLLFCPPDGAALTLRARGL